MSNRTSAPHTDRPIAPQPTPSTDRPTATYPTGRPGPFAGWRDRTPTGQVPVVAAPIPSGQPGPSRVSTRPEPTDGRETPIQDMGRPGILSRPSMAWHPSLMQLAIGAALVLALLGACNVAAIRAHRQARAHCHALVVSDWDRAQRECRGTGSGTPVPEQLPSSPHTPSPAPSEAPSPSTPPAFTRVNSPSPSTQPSTQPSSPSSPSTQPPSSPQGASTWVTRDTHAPYSKDDPAASPLDLPRCTTSPSTPLPCLASLSADGSQAVVLEEDASLTGLVRR